MKQELQDKLFEKYPLIFSYGGGFQCDDGWYQLIDTLCGHIQWHIDNRIESVKYYEASLANGIPWDHKPEPIEQVVAIQVKEKFGTLRFYVNGGDEYIEGMISMAEGLSGHICENCGNKGLTDESKGWIRTECNVCKEDRLSKRSGGI